VRAFGSDVLTRNIAQTGPISSGKSWGWLFDEDHPDSRFPALNGSFPFSAGPLSGNVNYKTTANVFANLSWNVSTTAVTARLLSGAVVDASLQAIAHGINVGSGLLRIFRLTQGGHATLKQDSGNQWRVDAANTAAMTDTAGTKLVVTNPLTSTRYTVYDVPPKSASDDYKKICTFTKAF
jgi:hypothetical protein